MHPICEINSLVLQQVKTQLQTEKVKKCRYKLKGKTDFRFSQPKVHIKPRLAKLLLCIRINEQCKYARMDGYTEEWMAN